MECLECIYSFNRLLRYKLIEILLLLAICHHVVLVYLPLVSNDTVGIVSYKYVISVYFHIWVCFLFPFVSSIAEIMLPIPYPSPLRSSAKRGSYPLIYPKTEKGSRYIVLFMS